MLANETVEGDELLDELRAIDAAGKAEYFVCVPANPIDTGQAMHEGAVFVWQATTEAAQARLDRTLEILRAENLHADGALGELPAAARAGRCGGGVQAGPAGHLHPSRGPFGVAPLRRGRPGPGDLPDIPITHVDRRVRSRRCASRTSR